MNTALVIFLCATYSDFAPTVEYFTVVLSS